VTVVDGTTPVRGPDAREWRDRLDAATAEHDPVFAVVDLDAFDANADDLARRAGGTPIRVASKSVRVRALLDRVLEHPGYAGVLAFTLPEALWLIRETDTGPGVPDVVVGYPTVHRAALRTLAHDRLATARVTLMVDDLAHLDLLDAVAPDRELPVRVCLDLDASWRPAVAGRRVHIGVRRSPLHSVEAIATLAAALARRRLVSVVAVMGYEAQIAGLGDSPPGRAAYGAVLRQIQSRSAAELASRRREAVAAVEAELAAAGAPPLELVNGGGTGSLEGTAAEGVATELAAGSGLFGPTLFDAYRAFSPAPAMAFAVPVVRRPAPGIVTVLGGGYVASGPASSTRLPTPWLPAGLSLSSTEGAGEVQTPLLGAAADDLAIGDRVWFRHAKAGEACERFDRVLLLQGVTGAGRPRVVDTVATYRGQGHTFL
jgi:D-serine deaminase-like pyridoxal phosphate-dependent protein